MLSVTHNGFFVIVFIVWQLQGGTQNVMPLIVHITHFYYYKNV